MGSPASEISVRNFFNCLPVDFASQEEPASPQMNSKASIAALTSKNFFTRLPDVLNCLRPEILNGGHGNGKSLLAIGSFLIHNECRLLTNFFSLCCRDKCRGPNGRADRCVGLKLDCDGARDCVLY